MAKIFVSHTNETEAGKVLARMKELVGESDDGEYRLVKLGHKNAVEWQSGGSIVVSVALGHDLVTIDEDGLEPGRLLSVDLAIQCGSFKYFDYAHSVLDAADVIAKVEKSLKKAGERLDEELETQWEEINKMENLLEKLG